MTVAPREGRRRALHVATGSAGLAAWFLPPPASDVGFAALVCLALILEAARHDSPTLSRRLHQLAGGAFRPAEARGLSGPTLLALGYAAAWFLFPGRDAAAAIMVTALADPAGALAGGLLKRAGSGKTWAGTTAVFATALAVLLVLQVSMSTALGAAAVAALAERIPVRGADNLALPVLTAAALGLLA